MRYILDIVELVYTLNLYTYKYQRRNNSEISGANARTRTRNKYEKREPETNRWSSSINRLIINRLIGPKRKLEEDGGGVS